MANKHKKSNFIRPLFVSTLLGLSALAFYNTNVKAQEETLEEKLFKRIESAAGVNNLEKVKDDIKRVLKLNPKHAGALFYAGKYCLQQGKLESAENFFKRIVYDPEYGSKANAMIADMKIKKYNSRFMSTLKIYLSGESFDQALKLSEEALADMPDNKDLLFTAAYASCMLNKKEKAETYSELYATQTNNSPLAAELKTLVGAWFTDSYENDLAIEKFLSLSSKNILTPRVKQRIRNLLIETKSIERYEEFIKKEKKQPNADTDNLDRELITFLLENRKFFKALDLINLRPIDSLEDNLLYIWALCETSDELKALNTAKALMIVAPRDLRVYKAWVKAWLSYTDKNKKMPEGKDSSGKTYQSTIDKIFKLIKPDKLVTQDPELLIDMLRMASFCGNEIEVQKIQLEVAKIAFNDLHEPLLMKLSDELVAFDRINVAINILESAVNQLPENYNLSLRLAKIYMSKNPTAAIRVCEEIMAQKPNLIRAVSVWCDAMNLAGRAGEAISELVKRLEDPSLNDIARRHLNSKLEQLRMQGADEEPYTETSKRKERGSFSDDVFEDDELKEDTSDNKKQDIQDAIIPASSEGNNSDEETDNSESLPSLDDDDSTNNDFSDNSTDEFDNDIETSPAFNDDELEE